MPKTVDTRKHSMSSFYQLDHCQHILRDLMDSGMRVATVMIVSQTHVWVG